MLRSRVSKCSKRFISVHRICPTCWSLPQILITLVFFIWPAGHALYQSLLIEDAFGLSTEFVWFENFEVLFEDEHYLGTFKRTVFFSVLVAGISMGFSLMLAAMADRIIKGAMAYRTLLIWPYAVAPVVAGALWVFMLDPTLGILTYGLSAMGYEWNHKLNGGEAMTLVVIAAAWKQVAYNFPVLSGGDAVDTEITDRSGRDRRCGTGAAFLEHHFPIDFTHDLLPAGGEYRLRVF